MPGPEGDTELVRWPVPKGDTGPIEYSICEAEGLGNSEAVCCKRELHVTACLERLRLQLAQRRLQQHSWMRWKLQLAQRRP